MGKLRPLNYAGVQFGIADLDKFKMGFQMICESLFDKGATMFASDNMITWNRNLSFLLDEYFVVEILGNNNTTAIEKSTIWRLYILLYFAEIAGSAGGDFLELGCHTGHTASNVIKKIDFQKLGKKILPIRFV
jgi:hypothetical protein